MRKRILFVVVATVVTVAILAWWLSGSQKETGKVSQAQTSQTTPAATGSNGLSEQNAQLLEKALSSADPADQAEALVPELRETYRQQGEVALPPGTKVTIDQRTFQAYEKFAQVEAIVGDEGRYVLHLTQVDGMWYIFNTEKR